MTEYDFRYTAPASRGSQITSDHFGAIYSTFYGLSAFLNQSDLVGSSGIRWPGGTRGEQSIDIYDKDGDGDSQEYLFSLTQDDLTTIPGKGLSVAMAAAVDRGVTFSTFMPSLRYVDNLDAAAADAQGFISKLIAGDYGILPSRLIIELGNESLDGSLGAAAAYGRVANALLTGANSAFAAAGIDPANLNISFAIQIGRSAAEDAAIRGQVSTSGLAMIDSLIGHHLPINIYNHNKIVADGAGVDAGENRYERSADYIEDWSRAVSLARKSAIGELDFIVSAWTVGPSSDVASSAVIYQDIGARQGRTTIDTFANLIGAGADGASLWGLDARDNPNWFTKLEGGVTEISHGGVVFQMMAESLQGMWLLDGYQQHWAMTGAAEAPVSVYAFEDADKYVIFVAANDIDGSQTVTLRFDDIDTSVAMQVSRLHTSTPLATGNLDARFLETPATNDFSRLLGADSFDFTVTEDYEVNRLIIAKDPAVSGPQWDSLTAADSLFSGSTAREVLVLGENGWSLRGTAADEVLVDNAGDDMFQGMGGSDVFAFRPNGGRNVIFDFEQNESGVDMLRLSGFGYETSDEARAHMTLTDEGVLFSDRGTTILLDGFVLDTIDHFIL
jgi:hypothetical protein